MNIYKSMDLYNAFLQLVLLFCGFRQITVYTAWYVLIVHWFCSETNEVKWANLSAILDSGDSYHTFGHSFGKLPIYMYQTTQSQIHSFHNSCYCMHQHAFPIHLGKHITPLTKLFLQLYSRPGSFSSSDSVGEKKREHEVK